VTCCGSDPPRPSPRCWLRSKVASAANMSLPSFLSWQLRRGSCWVSQWKNHRHIALTIALTLLQKGPRHECYKQPRTSSERANEPIALSPRRAGLPCTNDVNLTVHTVVDDIRSCLLGATTVERSRDGPLTDQGTTSPEVLADLKGRWCCDTRPVETDHTRPGTPDFPPAWTCRVIPGAKHSI